MNKIYELESLVTFEDRGRNTMIVVITFDWYGNDFWPKLFSLPSIWNGMHQAIPFFFSYRLN